MIHASHTCTHTRETHMPIHVHTRAHTHAGTLARMHTAHARKSTHTHRHSHIPRHRATTNCASTIVIWEEQDSVMATTRTSWEPGQNDKTLADARSRTMRPKEVRFKRCTSRPSALFLFTALPRDSAGSGAIRTSPSFTCGLRRRPLAVTDENIEPCCLPGHERTHESHRTVARSVRGTAMICQE